MRLANFNVRGRLARGSVLIIVLWVSFGLVSLALYFAHSMSFELRTSDNRLSAMEAELALEGAARYVSNILAQLELPGSMPDPLTYQNEAVPVGNAMFWLLARDEQQRLLRDPSFGLVDEGSKLNLNTATAAMLEALPYMTAELAAAIIDWRDADDTTTDGGAESDFYLRLHPAYRAKNGPFETVDELRFVMGADLEILFGEDTNMNGVLDPNENDAEISQPWDNEDGKLDRGLLEFVTVHSRESSVRGDGSAKVDVTGAVQPLRTLLEEKLGAERSGAILGRLGAARADIRSLLEFYTRSGMSADEFGQVETDMAVGATPREGLININTASEEVLACVPGIGIEKAPEVVARRLSNPPGERSVAWVTEVLENQSAVQAGPFLTGASYQFTADIAAVGRYGRGFRRARFVFDCSDGTPVIVFRQDLTHLGWALGQQTRETLAANQEYRW